MVACPGKSLLGEHHLQNPFHLESYTIKEDWRSLPLATLPAMSFENPADLMPLGIVSRREAEALWIPMVYVQSGLQKSGSALGSSTLNSSRSSDQTRFGHHSATSTISTGSSLNIHQNFGNQREWREGIHQPSLLQNWHGIHCPSQLIRIWGHESRYLTVSKIDFANRNKCFDWYLPVC